MALTLSIHPESDALLTLTIKTKNLSTGIVSNLLGGSVVGSLRQPNGRLVADDLEFEEQGAGVYTLQFESEWTEDENGKGREGLYSMIVEIADSGNDNQYSERIKLSVHY